MIKAILFDLDGTVYRGSAPVPGAPEFIRRLRAGGIRTLFVTNRANRTARHIVELLQACDIPAVPDDILTSSQATARYLTSGTVYCIGEEGLRAPLLEAGFTITDQSPRYVIVSLDRRLTYEKLETAALLIQNGAQFVATNMDRAVNTDKGLSPGTGAIVMAIQTATGTTPLVIGKPEPPIIEMALARLKVRKEEVILIGDNPDTDILAGNNCGIKTVLILTGVTDREAVPPHIHPDWIVEGYDALEPLTEEMGIP